MVAQQDEIAGFEAIAASAGGVRQNDGSAPVDDREPSTEHEVADGAPFVVVHSSGEDQHARVAEHGRDERAAMTFHGGDREVRDVRVRDRDRPRQAVGIAAEPRPERDRDPMVTPGDRAHVRARLVELFVELGHEHILAEFVS